MGEEEIVIFRHLLPWNQRNNARLCRNKKFERFERREDTHYKTVMLVDIMILVFTYQGSNFTPTREEPSSSQKNFTRYKSQNSYGVRHNNLDKHPPGIELGTLLLSKELYLLRRLVRNKLVAHMHSHTSLSAIGATPLSRSSLCSEATTLHGIHFPNSKVAQERLLLTRMFHFWLKYPLLLERSTTGHYASGWHDVTPSSSRFGWHLMVLVQNASQFFTHRLDMGWYLCLVLSHF